MGIFSTIGGFFSTKKEVDSKTNPHVKYVKPDVETLISSHSIPVIYDGEKSVGAVGPIKLYVPAYDRLRDRSWQLFLDSDLAQTVISRYILWIVKNGLRLQSTPVSDIVKTTNGIPTTFSIDKFARNVEQRFAVWQSDKQSTHNRLKTFKQLQADIYKNAIVGGDVLVILRRKKGNVNVQCIDGKHLECRDTYTSEDGNKIINGIEFNSEGEHVRYHVRTKPGTVVPVEAYDKETGLRSAWLQYGREHRLDNHRGIPIISTAIESIAKTDRYKDATIDQAEEIKKIAYVFEHDSSSDGSNPLADVMGEMMQVELEDQSIKRFESGEKIAKDVALSTGRKAINLPIGAKAKHMEAKNELYFKDFHTILADHVASTIGMPPNVAYSKYNDSFSASRAATKDWENTIDYARTDFDDQTLGHVYEYWLYWEVWSGRIQAPGLISAFENNDIYLKQAYLSHRFVGPKFPHIDPVKEVTAARLMLGTDMAHIPLTSANDVSESLMTGDFDTNVERASQEKAKSENLGFQVKQHSPQPKTEEDI